jgi:hypothetical protein
MIRTRTWVIAGIVLGGALTAGTILAQGYQPAAPAGAPAQKSAGMPATSGDQAAPRVYNPVSAETLGIASSAERSFGSFVKLPDAFYDEVTDFPGDAMRAGFNPQKYYAFRTRPDGSNLICFVQLENPDLAALKAARPVRGAEIFIMGTVGPRMLVGDGGATAFAVDRVVLGRDEPKASRSSENKPVVITIERFGPTGNVLKQEFTIKDPGQKYRIPDPADPKNAAKDIYVTLQF